MVTGLAQPASSAFLPIVDFLSQNLSSGEEKTESQIDVGSEEDEEDNILIPDEHPEQFTSLDELQQKL